MGLEQNRSKDVNQAWVFKCFDVVLSLLENDAEFPENYDVSDLNENIEHEKKLIELTEKRNQIHGLVVDDNLEQLKSLISGNNSKLVKLHLNDKNESAVFTAIKNKKFQIYAYLQSVGAEFKDKNEKNLLNDLSEEEKADIEDKLISYFPRSLDSHIYYLISKSRPSKLVSDFVEKVKTFYEALGKVKGVSEILQVIQYTDYLDIVYDFDNDDVTDVSPNSSKNTRGKINYKEGRLYIAAGSNRTEKEILGTIAHEMAHMALELIYENDCNPYRKHDEGKKLRFENITEKIRKKTTTQKDGPFLILSETFSKYSEYDQHSELIVRVPQILAQKELWTLWLKDEAEDLFHYYDELLTDFQNFIDDSYRLKPRKQIKLMNESLGEARRIREHYPLCFSDSNEIREFLERSAKKIFLVAGESSWLCVLKILHGLYGKDYINSDRYLVLKIQNFIKEAQPILQNFFQEGSDALIIQHSIKDYENENENRDRKYLDLLKQLLECKERKKIIFAVHTDVEVKIETILKRFGLDFISFNESHLSLRDLDVDSQKKILGKKIRFQKTEFPLTDLITDDKIKDLIDAETVDELINDKKIKVGSKIDGLASLDGAYANLKEKIDTDLLVHELLQSKNAIFVFEGFSKTEEIGLAIKKSDSKIEKFTEELLLLEGNGRLKKVKSCYADEEFKNLCKNNPEKDHYWIQRSSQGQPCLFLRKLYTPRFYLERNFLMPEKIVINCRKLEELTKLEDTKVLISNTNHTSFLTFYKSATTREEQNVKVQNKHLYISVNNLQIVFERIENKSDPENEKFEQALFNRITFVETEDDAQKIFDNLKKPNITVYWLKVEENDLIYKTSRGSLNRLRNCIDGNNSKISMVRETNFNDKIKQNKVIILSDDPGMGKTTTLTKLSESFSVDHWIIKINLLEFLKEAEKGGSTDKENILINCLSELSPKSGKNVTKIIIKSAVSQKYDSPISLLLSFDGFDEVLDEERRNKMIELFKFLKEETKVKFLITTRHHFKNLLEDNLSTFALQFQPMDNITKKEFIKTYFKLRLNLTLKKEVFEKKSFSFYAEKFLEKMGSIFKIELTRFIGTPLQLYLMLEDAIKSFKCWINRHDENGGDPNFPYFGKSMLEIYSKFVNKKYEYFKNMKKAGNEYSLESIKLECDKFHMKIAKKLTLNSKQKVSLKDFKDSSSKALACGIVKCQGNEIKFIHPTFLEYYAAMQFMKWIEKSESENKRQRLNIILRDVLQRPEFRIIRTFLNDMFLEVNRKKRKISSANLKYFKKKLNKNISSSRTQYIDVLIQEEHASIFEYLIKLMNKENFLNIKCRFGDSLLLYACRCNRKNIVGCILNKCNTIFKKRNKQNSLQFFKFLSFKGKSKETCLHHAAFYNNFDIIKLILDKAKVKCYSEQIYEFLEMRDAYENTLLNLSASYLGQFFSAIYEKLVNNQFWNLDLLLFNVMYQGKYKYLYPEIPYELLSKSKFQIMFNLDLHASDSAILLILRKLIMNKNITKINLNAHTVFELITNKIPKNKVGYLMKYKDLGGCNAIHYAVVNKDDDLLKIILQQVEKIMLVRPPETLPLNLLHEMITSKIDGSEWNVLHLAVLQAHLPFVQLFLQYAGKISKECQYNYLIIRDKTNRNVIHNAVMTNNKDITKFLMEVIPRNKIYKTLCSTDNQGFNVLHMSANLGSCDSVKLVLNKLLEKSSPTENLKNILFAKTTIPPYINPLHIAVLNDHLPVVILLLQYAEGISHECQYNYLISTDEKNRNVFYCAILRNDNKMIQCLLDMVPANKINETLCFTDNQGINLLHLLAYQGNSTMVEWILNKLLETSSSMKNLENILFTQITSSPYFNSLHLAVEKNHLNVVRILLKFAADISPEFQFKYLTSVDGQKNNAMNIAAATNHDAVLQVLIPVFLKNVL